jgi:Domain of unknown function (DUF4365)
MGKKITDNQLIGELGEAAVRTRFLSMGFQFDPRSRLEAGIDGIAEVMVDGEPTAKMIAVQVKSTRCETYTAENEQGFTYLLKSKDLDYWKSSNLPVIVVLYRQSDDTFYWASVPDHATAEQRKLVFSKAKDVLDRNSVDRLGQLTVPKNGFGYYVPPLGDGETALLNMLPVGLPKEMFVASTPYESKRAIALLFDQDEPPRFDWVIKNGAFWSFHDPRESVTAAIVDLDQVEAFETQLIAFHEDIDEQNNFAYLLRDKENRLFFCRAQEENQPKRFHYQSSKNRTHADVVTVATRPKEPEKVSFVRHHAFIPKFECMMEQWFLMVSPTYHFTTNGFRKHSYPHALLSGKKRMDNNASLRGQVIMWHRMLSDRDKAQNGLFSEQNERETLVLHFAEPPEIELPTIVPEDAWEKPKVKSDDASNQGRLFNEA